MTDKPIDGRAGIDAALVRRLIAEQFPQWRGLTVSPVPVDGWDNRTYRLGDQLTVRLPTDKAYEPAVSKEHRWLPVLAGQLPLPIPEPLALGVPSEQYPYHWSVRRWLDGRSAIAEPVPDLARLASDLADFLLALQRIDPAGGPAAGAHSFYRGGSLTHYHDETVECLARLAGRLDTEAVGQVWQAALAADRVGAPVWFHGDVAAGNLLVRDGRLAAVIDFGTSGVGDPACDLVIAWTLLHGRSRQLFRQRLGLDLDCWARARGWALWKALLGIVGDADPLTEQTNRRVIAELIAEHRAGP